MTGKTLEHYLSLPYRLIIEKGEEDGVYVAYFPELPGCATTAGSIEAVRLNAMDAKRCWLEAALEDGYEIREPENDTIYQQVVA